MREESVRLYAKEHSRHSKAADLKLENNGSKDEGVKKLVDLINSLSRK